MDDPKYIDLIKRDNYKKSDITKLHTLSQDVKLKTLHNLLSKVAIQRINKKNINLVLEFISNESAFINKQIKIEWGPGNHGEINLNINKHYEKHVLSNEGNHWKNLLANMNSESYANYAIDNFYKMKKVMVHSNGVNAHISGFYGNVFIIGRYHEGVFGISSCYYVESGVKQGRLNNFCFDLEFY